IGIAERHVELAGAAPHQRRLRGGHRAGREGPLGRLHDADHLAAAPYGEARRKLAVVRPGARNHAVEREVVAADRDLVARLERGDALAAPLRLAGDAEQSEAEPEMRERRAPDRAR